MNQAGWIIALWAAMVPLVMMFLFFLPPYAFVILSLWIVYDDQVFIFWDDVSKVANTVSNLYRYWEVTPSVGFFDFFVPVFGPMILGCLVSLTLVYMFYRYIRGIFRV